MRILVTVVYSGVELDYGNPIRLKSRMESLRQAAMAHGDAAVEPFSQLLRHYRLDPNELPDENGAAEQNAEPELPITGF